MIKVRKYLQNTVQNTNYLMIYIYIYFRNSVRILKSLFAPHEEFTHTVYKYGSTEYEKTDYFYRH